MSIQSAFLLAGMTLLAQSPASAATRIDDLIAKGAEVQKLAGGFRFTEGPAWDGKGALYFSDIPNERIHRWADGRLSVFREKSGRANGLYFDARGNLLMCEGGSRRLTRADMGGGVSVLAATHDGKKLNSPNDLWIDPQGGVYFTDPRYGKEDDLEQDGFHVYHLPAAGGGLRRVIHDLVKPNGIIGSRDGKRLYVADAGGGKTYVYTIRPDGGVGDRRLAAPEGSDGMTLDEHGNLYLTKGAVKVYRPDAKLIGAIQIPEGPANVTFGGKDGRTLFITARTGLYSLRMKVKGQHN
jgi:gluconolactonase